MAKRRNRFEIIFDILNSIRNKGGTIKPTHLLYKSNLSHNMMNEYLSELISKEFITEHIDKKNKIFSLTKKGYIYLTQFEQVKVFMESFGLDEL